MGYRHWVRPPLVGSDSTGCDDSQPQSMLNLQTVSLVSASQGARPVQTGAGQEDACPMHARCVGDGEAAALQQPPVLAPRLLSRGAHLEWRQKTPRRRLRPASARSPPRRSSGAMGAWHRFVGGQQGSPEVAVAGTSSCCSRRFWAAQTRAWALRGACPHSVQGLSIVSARQRAAALPGSPPAAPPCAR